MVEVFWGKGLEAGTVDAAPGDGLGVGAVKVVDGLDPGVDGNVVVVEEGDQVGVGFFDGAMAGDGGTLDGFVDVAKGDL